jgi:hypothetical protein
MYTNNDIERPSRLTRNATRKRKSFIPKAMNQFEDLMID